MDWDHFRYFLELARAGTLAGAARRLDVEHTTVSRRLQALDIEVKAYVPSEGITKLHSKVWIFTHDVGKPDESRRVIGGTVNAIKGAYEYNHEVGVLFYGEGVGEDVQAAFDEDFTRNAADIPKLGKWDRFKSGIVELLNMSII